MISAIAGGVRVTVHVSPGASATTIAGTHGNALKLRLAAPPVEGRANEALVVFMAAALGVARRDVTIVRGQTARRKTVEVMGVSVATATARLAAP